MRRKLKRNDREALIVEAVADFVATFDSAVKHDWRLSDCILLKFNLINKRQVRRNVVRVPPIPERRDQ